MYSIFKRLNKKFSTIKNIKPTPKPKKHRFDIENEPWTKQKKQKQFTYSYIRYIFDLTERIERKEK